MNLGKTSFKAAILATIIFNLLLISEESINSDYLWITPISFLIFLVISFFAIITTIYPFNNENKNPEKIFNTYFPYYAIATFIGGFIFIYINDFEEVTILISLTTFFTAMAAWLWLFEKNEILK